ncbi:MAG: hypothetical protein COB69_09960 [Phycisphaera sp.]|nr:MAG: hypothetical protein COB69_10440 [Phycisphaera sp.]PHQ78442.1 MAG: hypothetical protein COB69_09960 [Phycisphaera sp.]
MSGKLLSVLLLSGLAAPCAAQAFGDDADAGIEIAPAKRVSFFATGHADISSEGRTSSRQGGKVSTYSLDARITAEIPIDDQTDMSVSFAQHSTAYDFSGFNSFGFGRSDPINFGSRSTLSADASHSIDRNWTLFGGASLGSSGEVGAEFGDTLTFGGFFGIMHHIHADLSIGFALAGFTRLEDDATIFPIPTIRWNIDDYWTLTAGGDTSSRNPGIELSHELNDDWDVGLNASIDYKQFRLEDDNSAVPGGVIEDYSIPLMFVATWSPEPRFSISGRVGAVVYREFELRNSSGNTLSDAKIDPTFAFGISGEYRF